MGRVLRHWQAGPVIRPQHACQPLCLRPGVGGCQHPADADLHRLVESGRGDVLLTHLRFRCSNCGSDRRATTRSRGELRETGGPACQRPSVSGR